jgi:hypothetical protein
VAQSSNRVCFKVHRRDKNEILAVCDESLLGQEVFNKKSRMRIPVDFYKGKTITPIGALRLMKNYSNVNAIGSVLELGIQQKVINPNAIIWFNTTEGKKVPHLLIFSFPPI